MSQRLDDLRKLARDAQRGYWRSRSALEAPSKAELRRQFEEAVANTAKAKDQSRLPQGDGR